MTITLDHTIVHVTDRDRAAASLTDVLGLAPHTNHEIFAVVRLANGAALCFADSITDALPMHYAFLVGEDDFDAVRARLDERGIGYFTDPSHRHSGVNDADGRRQLYWNDADGNLLEIITVPDDGWPV